MQNKIRPFYNRISVLVSFHSYIEKTIISFPVFSREITFVYCYSLIFTVREKLENVNKKNITLLLSVKALPKQNILQEY